MSVIIKNSFQGQNLNDLFFLDWSRFRLRTKRLSYITKFFVEEWGKEQSNMVITYSFYCYYRLLVSAMKWTCVCYWVFFTLSFVFNLLNRWCFISCKCIVLYHIYNMYSVVLPVSICVSDVHCFHPTCYISIVDVLFYKVYMVTCCITWCQSRYWGIMVSFEIECKKFHQDLYVEI